MRRDLTQYLTRQAIDAPIPSSHKLPYRISPHWAIGAALLGLVFLWLALPALIGGFYAAAGARALAAAGDDATARAVVSLEQARGWSPSEPLVYRRLAQAYLRQGRPQDAITALEQAFRLQPGSLLIRQELAQAYEANGDTLRADALWVALGMTPQRMVAMGDGYLEARQPEQALAWYDRAIRLGAEKPSLQFRIVAAAAMMDRALVQFDALGMPMVYPLDTELQIEAEALQWIPSGRAVSETPAADTSIGGLWGNGATVAVVDVEQAGRYRVAVRAQHSVPAPILLTFEHDLALVAAFSLERADGSWDELETDVYLDRGFHLIGLRFLNDEFSNGADRNAFVDWVRLRLQADAGSEWLVPS